MLTIRLQAKLDGDEAREDEVSGSQPYLDAEVLSQALAEILQSIVALLEWRGKKS
jgi:hypothetical protein